MRFSKRCVLLFVAALMPAAQAVRLGAIGPTYPIGEENALDLILSTLRSKARSGELKRLQEAAVRRTLQNLYRMKPVAGIRTVTQRAQRLIDPTVTTSQPVMTDKGRLVMPAGTRINPLDFIHLSKRLVFFDGRDPAQCEAVHKLLVKAPTQIKPILVAGAWLDLTKTWKTQVYVDQHGVLSKRFGIRAVPSVIHQQHKRLVLDEIPAKELQ